MEKVHFIAVGGSIMHNLALALHNKGLKVTGSDDLLFEPSKSRLESKGIINKTGWNDQNITEDLSAVIVGMHAKRDNPELLKAQKLAIPIYSFPEYIYQHSQNKQRVVIAGSHGKTSVTSIVMHVLSKVGKEFDYAVGAQLEGFETMVQLSDAPVIIIEGDEYLSSPLDLRPKFLSYHHHILLINGIAWDHMNAFPTFESYVEPFEELANATPKAGTIIYFEKDKLVNKIGAKGRPDVTNIPYKEHPSKVVDGKTYLLFKKEKIEVPFFGKHNLINVSAAKEICSRICVNEKDFYGAIQSFKGAAKRLELVGENKSTIIYKDFAHAPSKLKATSESVKEQYPKRKLVACIELHTFSSLNKEFLNQYKDSFNSPDLPLVFIDPEIIKKKGIGSIEEEEIKNYFGNKNLRLIKNVKKLTSYLKSLNWENTNLLLMSSGNFGDLDIEDLSKTILS